MGKVLRSNNMNKCIGCFTCQRVCAGINHKSFTDDKSAIKIRTLGGISGKFFATHCLACSGDIACLNACPTGALTERPGGGVVLNEKKCIHCKKCAETCIVKAIYFTDDNSPPIICKHCGICVKYCPHKCLTMEEKEDA
ncbi:MAG: 4Fe-4S binding protein [Eubacteriales bacterium]